MKCRKCGNEIEEGYEICLNCGSAVDFEESADSQEQEKKIEDIIKKKPVNRLSRQMMGGILAFVVACLFVGVCMSYAAKTLNMYSEPGGSARAPEAKTETTVWTPSEPTALAPNIIVNDNYRKLPLRITSFSASSDDGIMPKLYITAENISDSYAVNSFTVRIVAFDKEGKRVYKTNSESGGYTDFTYRKSIAPGKKSQIAEVTMTGFQKGVEFEAAIISAQSSDGYKYEPKESSLSWKSASVKKDK